MTTKKYEKLHSRFFFLNIFIVTLYFQPFLQYINKFLTSQTKKNSMYTCKFALPKLMFRIVND